MNEVQSGLIEMNAHMVMEDWAIGMTTIGFAILGITATILLLDLLVVPRNLWTKKYWYRYILILVLSFFFAMIGVKAPRIKVIKACASGPISMEQIAIKYDIMEVDGKELTLKER